MIDIKQLRIGNLVSLAHESNSPIGKVISTHPDRLGVIANGQLYVLYPDLVVPIELSPAWLGRLGFNQDDDDFLLSIDDRSSIHINLIKNRALIESYDGVIAIPNKPTYVHQLQSLYYSLTGEELTIKTD
jgi:hypothetical protein